MKNSIVLSFLTVVMVIGLMATPAQAEKPDTLGGPFQDLWSALNGAVASLQAQIDGIQEYLQQLTETDPIYSASPASGIQNTDITNWNAAYGWGDHSTAGYLTFIPSNVIEEGENVSLLTNDAGYLTSVELGVETASRIAADNALQSQINNIKIPKLGAWQSKSINTVYRAATDGFVVAKCWNGVDKGNTGIDALTDGSNPPTTVRAKVFAVNSWDHVSITMAVRKGDYWKVSAWKDAALQVVYWISFGD